MGITTARIPWRDRMLQEVRLCYIPNPIYIPLGLHQAHKRLVHIIGLHPRMYDFLEQ